MRTAWNFIFYSFGRILFRFFEDSDYLIGAQERYWQTQEKIGNLIFKFRNHKIGLTIFRRNYLPIQRAPHQFFHENTLYQKKLI